MRMSNVGRFMNIVILSYTLYARFSGGVLEPEGTVEIKYRTKDILKTIHRCDRQCIDILKQLRELGDSDKERQRQLEVRAHLFI